MEGRNIIGYQYFNNNADVIQAIDPSDGSTLEGDFHPATDDEIDRAMELATDAFKVYKFKNGEERALFLEAIADEIMDLGDELIERASKETALPEARLKGERGRTVNQLKLFAALVKEGSWVDASIDVAQPDREPAPKPDIRKMLIGVGPVVVFTASNFPFAFSTAGGDTAAALAGGNPVVIKVHESHLGTNQLVAEAIKRAAEKTGMPNGVFSSLIGIGHELGKKLVLHPLTRSVAFTGSRGGGKALYDIASQREEPIPVFAEMGSINPVVLLPEKIANDCNEVAKMYAGSITLGVGQFCTNPGLLIGLDSPGLDDFIEALGRELEETVAGTMLNERILEGFQANRKVATGQPGVVQVTKSNDSASATLAAVSGEKFLDNPKLKDEVFGPYSLVVKCRDEKELTDVLHLVRGQLTATLMCTDDDLEHYGDLVTELTEVAGRVIFNGVPTGVEVCHSMHHGGPFPATTDSRFSSVGTEAIRRFVRPVCYQDAPQSLLPDELKNENPLGIWRKVDGKWSRDKI